MQSKLPSFLGLNTFIVWKFNIRAQINLKLFFNLSLFEIHLFKSDKMKREAHFRYIQLHRLQPKKTPHISLQRFSVRTTAKQSQLGDLS